MPSTRAEEIARDFEAANDEVARFAQACTAAQWTATVPGENWPVGVVVHHVAAGHRQCLRWLGLVSRGEAVLDSASQIDADNARHARQFADVAIADTIEELRRNGADLAGLLRALGPDELARSAAFGPGDGIIVTTEDLAGVCARHCRVHLEAARSAAGSVAD